MSELNFTRENNEKYNTINIKIENAIIELKENDFYIINTENTKYGYRKVNLRINNDDLKEKLKSWETEINEYLKSEVGTGPIKVLYGYKMYCKLSKKVEQEEKKYFINVRSVWINENNKPFIQLWYVKHTN